MSAADDMRELVSQLDGLLVGWIGSSRSLMTTVRGAEAETLIRTLREKRFKHWGENLALRSRLARALDAVDGLRAANEALTTELEARRGP